MENILEALPMWGLVIGCSQCRWLQWFSILNSVWMPGWRISTTSSKKSVVQLFASWNSQCLGWNSLWQVVQQERKSSMMIMIVIMISFLPNLLPLIEKLIILSNHHFYPSNHDGGSINPPKHREYISSTSQRARWSKVLLQACGSYVVTNRWLFDSFKTKLQSKYQASTCFLLPS